MSIVICASIEISTNKDLSEKEMKNLEDSLNNGVADAEDLFYDQLEDNLKNKIKVLSYVSKV